MSRSRRHAAKERRSVDRLRGRARPWQEALNVMEAPGAVKKRKGIKQSFTNLMVRYAYVATV